MEIPAAAIWTITLEVWNSLGKSMVVLLSDEDNWIVSCLLGLIQANLPNSWVTKGFVENMSSKDLMNGIE